MNSATLVSVLVALALAGLASPAARAADNTWIGGASGAWGLAKNWSQGRIPIAADNAINAPGEMPAIRRGNHPVGSLSFAGGLSVAGGSLTLQENSFVRENLAYSAGSLFVNRGLEVGDEVARSGGLLWSSSGIRGGGTLRLLGPSTIFGNRGPKTLAAYLEVDDRLTWTGSSLSIDFQAVGGRDPIYITPNGRWLDAGDRNHVIDGGVGGGWGVSNSGLYSKGGAGTTTILNFTNPGRIVVGSGALVLQNLRSYDAARRTLIGGGYTVGLPGGGPARLRIGIGAGNRITGNEAGISLVGPNARFETAPGVSALKDLTLNAGSIALTATAVTIDGPLANVGTISVNGAASLTVNGKLTIGSAEVPGGVTHVVGGLLRADGGLDIIDGGRLEGFGVLAVPGLRLLAGRLQIDGLGGLDDGGALGITGPIDAFRLEGDFHQTGGVLGVGFSAATDALAPRLEVTGLAELGGLLSVDFLFNPQPLDSFLVLSADEVVSAFDAVQVAGLASGLETQLRYTGSQVWLDVSVVPEPATWALLLAGIGFVAAAARRALAR